MDTRRGPSAKLYSLMDASSIPLALVAPLSIGGELLPGVRLVAVSSELAIQLRFEIRGSDVVVEIEPRDDSRPSAARTALFQYAYRTGDKSHPLDGRLGRALCNAVARAAATNEHAVVDLLRRSASETAPSEHANLKIRQVRVEHILERSGALAERYYTLSPYVGCLIGCHFCYAQTRLSTLRRLQGLPDIPWGSWVDARMNSAECLARELQTAEPWPIKFCLIVSDPYHAIERKFRLTRACLEVLRDAETQRQVVVLTRSPLVREDAGLLASLPQGYAGVSLPTIDEAVRRHFEPRGASVAERVETLRALRTAGVRTFAVIQPQLPGDVVALADALADSVESVRIDILRGVVGAAEDFSDARYQDSASEEWQLQRAHQLRELLVARGVKIWPGELPL